MNNKTTGRKSLSNTENTGAIKTLVRYDDFKVKPDYGQVKPVIKRK